MTWFRFGPRTGTQGARLGPLLPLLCLSLVAASFSSASLLVLLPLLLLPALLVRPSLVLVLLPVVAADLLLFFFLSSGEDLLFTDRLRSRGSEEEASGLDRLGARGRDELESFMGERGLVRVLLSLPEELESPIFRGACCLVALSLERGALRDTCPEVRFLRMDGVSSRETLFLSVTVVSKDWVCRGLVRRDLLLRLRWRLLLRVGGEEGSATLVLPRVVCDDVSEILALTRLGNLAGRASMSTTA